MGKVKSNNKMLEKMAKAEAEKDGKWGGRAWKKLNPAYLA